jgi:acetyl esterase/lipase
MADAIDALEWIRTTLPSLSLSRADVRVNTEKVVAVGWSSGGHLAASLAWQAPRRQIAPPAALLIFYSPLDYEDAFWTSPNVPRGSRVMNGATSYELDDRVWSGIADKAVTAYHVPRQKRALGGWLAPTDPRSRLALYMNWHGRHLDVLLGGLDPRTRRDPPSPDPELVRSVSPLAHIRAGRYANVPTFVVHPREDDLVPWQQAERAVQSLRVAGIEAQLRIVERVPHLFDTYDEHMKDEAASLAVVEGYEFLCSHVGLTFRG